MAKQRHICDNLRASSCKGGRLSRLRRTKVLSDTKPHRKLFSQSPFRALGVILSRLRSFPSPAGPSWLQDRHHGHAGSFPAHPCGSMCEPEKALQRPHSSSQTGSIRSLARSVQISSLRASPARLLWQSGVLSRACRGCLGLQGTCYAQILSMRPVSR